MLIRRCVVGVFSVGTMVVGATTVYGQNYPHKPIRIVTAEPGGGGDIVARLIASGLSSSMGQQVIVDNRQAGLIAGQIVSRAPPDGYTLLVSSGVLWLMPFMQDTGTMGKDLSPITLANRTPNVLVVHPSVAANSVKELIALAKAKPGNLNYASGPNGAPNHLAAELFTSMAGVNIMRVTYKGSGPGLNDLIGGQVQLMFPNAASVAPHIKSGRLRALAVTSLQPSTLVPGLPTVAESGLPGYESVAIYCMFGPAKMPARLVNRLNQGIVRFLNRADVKERFLTAGIETVGSSPEQLAATMTSEMARIKKLFKDAGIRAE